jgi:hypothetical protein
MVACGSRTSRKEQTMKKDYKRTPVVVYRIEVEGGNYPTTHIRIGTRDRISVAERLTASIRDPDYFGPPQKWEELCRWGAEDYFEIDFSQREVYLSYTHTKDGSGYCFPRVKTNDGLGCLRWATKLLTKVSREAARARDRYYGPKDQYDQFIESPSAVVAALKDIGAIEIEYTPHEIGTSEAVGRWSGDHQWLKEEAA